VGEGEAGLSSALDRIAKEAEAAVDAGFSFLVLSDRGFGPDRVPVSPLLATGEPGCQVQSAGVSHMPCRPFTSARCQPTAPELSLKSCMFSMSGN
jgi:hypothetical protein